MEDREENRRASDGRFTQNARLFLQSGATRSFEENDAENASSERGIENVISEGGMENASSESGATRPSAKRSGKADTEAQTECVFRGADAISVLRVIAMTLVFLLHAKGVAEEFGFDQSACGKWAFLWQAPAWGGVWIFFLLSGYLIGKGFFSGRYGTDKKGVLQFYYKRWLKIGLPTYVAAALISVFFCTEFVKSQPLVLLRILTFTYNGIPGADGIGALWYISTLMQLYLLSPLAFALGKAVAKGLSPRKKALAACLLFTVLAALGAGFRTGMLRRESAWYEWVYAPFWGNLDLYFCGFLLAFFAGKRRSALRGPLLSAGKILSCALLSAVVLFASFSGYYDGWHARYIALCPTLFLLSAGAYLLFFDALPGGIRAEKFTLAGWGKRPSLAINGIAEVSFEFYLLHSVVLVSAPRFAVRSNVGIYLSLCLYAAVVTLLCSVFFRAGMQLFSLPKKGRRFSGQTGFRHTSLKKWAATLAAVTVAAIGVWCWCARTPYSGLPGSGTAADPYRIATCADYLQFTAEVNAGKTFRKRVVVLTADLDFAGERVDPCGSTKTGKKFSGTFDGQGHVISRFLIEGDDRFGYDIGLFGWIEDGGIYNLGLEEGRVTGSCLGAFVSAGRGKVVNCYSNIELIGARTGAVCDNFYGEVANCWSLSVLNCPSGAIGISSYPATGIAVKNCYLAAERLGGAISPDGANALSAAEMNGGLFAAAMNAYTDPERVLVRFVPGEGRLRFAA